MRRFDHRPYVAGPLSLIRRRSSLSVNMPPPSGRGLGNLLSYFFWAYSEQAAGHRSFVLRTGDIEPWIPIFPKLLNYLIRRTDMPFTCSRLDWMDQTFPATKRPLLEAFIREVLLTAPNWQAASPAKEEVITVNIRRGDYYSDERWRALYGFDIATYVRVAVEGSLEQQPASVFRVVSDGPEWCRENLAFLGDYGRLEFQPPSDGPAENLLQLSTAKRLVLANSSFSYWAGYMSNVWHHGENYETIWAPSFHRRDLNDGRAWQLDPRWSIVHEIPGGW